MTRLEAIELIIRQLRGDELIVHANGAISRESFHCEDRRRNFYMIGSMGLVASIALGLSLAKPQQQVIALDGDGNLLMGFGNLALVGACRPNRFIHVVLDNQAYGTTGNQPTLSPRVPLADVARACGYRTAAMVSREEDFTAAFQSLFEKAGPHFLQVRVSQDVPIAPGRIPYTALQIKERFMAGIGILERSK